MKPFASLVSAFALSAVVTGTIALGAGLVAGTAPFGAAYAVGTPSSSRVVPSFANEPITVGGVTFASRADFIMAGKRCGTPEPTAAEIKAMNAAATGFVKNETVIIKGSDATTMGAGSRSSVQTPRRPGSVIVPVYVHLVGFASTIATIPDARVAAQIDVMNNGFSGRIPTPVGQIPSAQATAKTAFQYRLMGITRTIIPDDEPERLFQGYSLFEIDGVMVGVATESEYETRASLRRGGPETLNLYIGDLPGGLLGYATFPAFYGTGRMFVINEDDELVEVPAAPFDGVACVESSMPNDEDPSNPYNLGITAVHEVGHWLGLFHTFQGSCTNVNDGVSDTPAEASPYFGQAPNPAPDTCITIPRDRYPGRDPFENFMD
ncbi:MAG: hypothetical protein H7Y38_18030, partial [Armatimonadetes bacterium]|nr:hypothetical protein [Armatimonadota bacterium]